MIAWEVITLAPLHFKYAITTQNIYQMKFFYLCISNCLLCYAALCQNTHTVDSLQTVLKTDISVKQRIDIYNQLSKEYAVDSLKVVNYTTQAVKLAKKINYAIGMADASYRLACFKLYRKNFPEAAKLLDQTLQTAQKSNYKKGLSNAYNGMGDYHKLQGNSLKATEMYEQALEIDTQIGNKIGVARSLNNLGIIYSHQGNYPKATKAYQRALKITHQIGSKRGMASCYTNLANIYLYQSNYPKALEMYQPALKIFKQIGKKKGIAVCYNNLGVIHKHLGNHSKELEMHRQSLKINQQIGNKEGLTRNYNSLGNFYFKRGNYPKALEMYQQALKINTQIGDKRNLIKNYSNIANLYELRGEYLNALKTYQQALRLSVQLDNKRELAYIYNRLGKIHRQLNNDPQAQEDLQKGLQISQQIGDTSGVAQSYLELGQSCLAHRKVDEAKKHFEKALMLFQHMGEKDFSATAWVHLGITYYTQKNYPQAQHHLEKGKQVAQKTGRLAIVKTSTEYLAKVYQATGQLQKALLNHILFKQMADSLLNEKNIRQITQLEDQFRFNKEKDSLRRVQVKQKATMQAQLAKEQDARRFQWWVSTLTLIILIILGLFAFSVWRSQHLQRRLNTKLKTQKDDILIKNNILQQNEEEIRTKADIITYQRDTLANTNQALQTRNKMIEEQKQTLEETLHQLKELDHFKVQTTHMIAHDLKNPLQAIITLSENTVLAQDQPTIHQAGQRMMLLIQNMLDTQKMQQTQLSIQIQPFCLSQLCSQAIAQVSWLAQAKGLVIDYQVPENLAVLADPDLLLRVLVNLLHNGLSYTPSPGRVTIRCAETTPAQVKVEVIDTGVGIAPKDLAQVFDPYRHGALRKSSTGLGLTFCKMAIEAQQGQIGVESELGSGSNFWLLLPLANTGTIPASSDEHSKATPCSLAQPTLSAEDQALLQPYLEQLKQHSVYHITQVNDILEQIEAEQSPQIEAWKTTLEQVIFTLDQTRYEELVQ